MHHVMPVPLETCKKLDENTAVCRTLIVVVQNVIRNRNHCWFSNGCNSILIALLGTQCGGVRSTRHFNLLVLNGLRHIGHYYYHMTFVVLWG